MEISDIIITPLMIGLLVIPIIFISYRNMSALGKYFRNGIILKLVGSLALGVIYKFYYGYGDTFNYHRDGKIIASALKNDPLVGLNLFLSHGNMDSTNFEYSSKLVWFSAISEFTVSKLSALLGFIFFDSYFSISLGFALISFSGMWAWFKTLIKIYPNYIKEMAFAVFLIPSVIFWGSGLMKDTITLGALGWLFFGFYHLVVEKKKILVSICVVIISLYLLYVIRIYLLLAFLPPAIIWSVLESSSRIKNKLARRLLVPFLLIASVIPAAYIATSITEGHQRYDLDNVNKYIKINSDYLYYISQKEGGSTYSLGNHDGTLNSTIKMAPAAFWVSMFRPYVWESKNIVMLISALESTSLMILTLFVLYKVGPIKTIKIILSNPYLPFALIFSTFLAIAVGMSSYNFGTLVRYKIPILPFYVSAILIIYRIGTQGTKSV